MKVKFKIFSKRLITKIVTLIFYLDNFLILIVGHMQNFSYHAFHQVNYSDEMKVKIQ